VFPFLFAQSRKRARVCASTYVLHAPDVHVSLEEASINVLTVS